MRVLLFLTLLSFINSSFAQIRPSDNKQAQRKYEQAGSALSTHSYETAIELLKAAVKEDDQFAAAWQQLGDVYRKKENYEEAKSAYRKVITINPAFSSLTRFGLAESELNTGEYQNALRDFLEYLNIPTLPAESRKKTEKLIADCRYALKAVQKPLPFAPVNMGTRINTAAQEYLPALTADEHSVIFTRRTNNNEDFYKSDKDSSGWKTAVYLSRQINTDDLNEGGQCITPDGAYLFFTGCNRPDGLGRCDIYVAKREGNDWSEPFNLGAPVNTAGWEAQPSISADGRQLYFVSSRPGGLGGNDIWRADLNSDGGWSAPVNLGPQINTVYDEQSPFIHPDNETLYFSSNGWPGMGNKDIFLSRADSAGNWLTPQNLGFPINTYGEESSLTVSTNGRNAFFASNMPGGQGSLDIYSFELPQSLRPAPVTYVKGRVFDKSTGALLQASIIIRNLRTNGAVYEGESDPGDGTFLATMRAGKEYGMTVAKEGYLFYSENFSLGDRKAASETFNLSIPLETIAAGRKVVLRNIFFETGKYNLLPESKAELDQLTLFLTENPRIKIEISGHTDNVGNDKSNSELSQNRARQVYDYLLSNKIDPRRLTYKGYGSSLPAADNHTDEGRRINRRTEFKILSY